MAKQGVGMKMPPQGNVGYEVEMPPRESRQEPHALLRKGEHEINVPLQGPMRENTGIGAKHCDRASTKEPNEGTLATSDPGRRLPRKYLQGKMTC
jgi:hypothetical protein